MPESDARRDGGPRQTGVQAQHAACKRPGMSCPIDCPARVRHPIPFGLHLLVVMGCSVLEPPPSPPPVSFPVTVAVHGGADPLAGVQVIEGDSVLGTTDATGLLNLTLSGAEGDTATLRLDCPDGFASPPQPLAVGLRLLAPGSPAPRFDVDCVELVHTVVAGVRSENGPDLPIIHLNQVIGLTDSHGVGHVLLETTDDQPITLTLDTRQRPDLLPQSPTLTFVAPATDALVLLEQKFAIKKAPPVRRKAVSLPTRIGS
jgi:hypothetical protein